MLRMRIFSPAYKPVPVRCWHRLFAAAMLTLFLTSCDLIDASDGFGGEPDQRMASGPVNAEGTETFWGSLRNFFGGATGTLPFDPNGPAQVWRDDGNGAAPTHWQPVTFQQLEGWRRDDHAAAFAAFLRSCDSIDRRPGDARMGSMSYSGYAQQWQHLCATAKRTPRTSRAARRFFERYFQPYYIPGPGKFTGYYEASLNGSRVRTGRYQWPIYRKPGDELSDLTSLTRAQIDAGGLSGRGLELLWIDNPVDIFFLQIQGSGVVRLRDGRQVRVGYAGNNGEKFTGLLPALKAKGYDPDVEGLTIQAYRNWLLRNPGVAREVMNHNPRYIYFDINEAPAARGDGGTLLTPQRSMAVDKAIIPLHAPLWLTTNVPGPQGMGQESVSKLMIAQDTGAAIKGEIRGDYYWGPGREAFARAGRMYGQGTYQVLLPTFIPSH